MEPRQPHRDNLLSHLHELAVLHTQSAPARQKSLGQYFTEPPVALFMANFLVAPFPNVVRVLDPGAGTGILGLSAALRLLRAGVERVEVFFVEVDSDLVRQLRHTLDTVGLDFQDRFSYKLFESDFLELAEGQLGLPALPSFHIAISNPPYFKMSPKKGPGGTAPNAYARFMEMSARLLEPHGQLCFIVPRSFTSGFYFRGFRRTFHQKMHLTALHTFQSRSDLFRKQQVLQENIVVLYRRDLPSRAVHVSASANHHDLGSPRAFSAHPSALIDPADQAQTIRVPTSPEDLRLLRLLNTWSFRLADHGLEISTGPVVPFRAPTFLLGQEATNKASYPLLWLQHVNRNEVFWPIGDHFTKPERISVDAPEKLIVPNRNYVLLRRFSAKEDPHRLTSAVLPRGLLPGDFIGLENHLNFIHRPGGELQLDEAYGLSALLNSHLYDRYFRVTNGNTQVGAAEIRALPLPSPDLLARIGAAFRADGANNDDLVNDALSPS